MIIDQATKDLEVKWNTLSHAQPLHDKYRFRRAYDLLAVDHAKESYDSVIFSDHCKAGRTIHFSYLLSLIHI